MSTNSPDSTNPSPEVIAGIDLGTTYSSIALFREGQIQVLDIDGSPLLPSYVGLSESNELLVGHPARNQYILYPEKTIKSIKRRMGGTESILLGDRSFLPEEISALILGYMKQKAEAALGFPIRRAVITVPAFFNDTQRQATRAAGEIAGLEVVRILNEPTAASLAFRKSLLSQNQSHRGISVVYDLGGGTFDVSIVNEESDLTEVLASRGDTRLGGDDFDRLILEHFLAHLQREYRVDLRDDRRALHRLTHAAEAAKIGLSSNPYTQVVEEEIAVVNGKSIHLDLELSRREYEEMIHNLIDRTLDCVHEAMRDAQVTPAQVENVLLAGGSTRTPLVREVLENLFEKEPRSELHPDLCVAMGAGILAARLQGLEVEQILVDITPHTFGIAALHIEPDGYPNPYYFARIVPRNTPLPVTRSEEFSTVIDDQEIVNVQIFQGEDDDIRYNTQLGNFHIQGLSKVPAGNLIIARMTLNLNGILTVTAIEKQTGLQKSIRIEGAYKPKELKDILESRDRLSDLLGAPEPAEAPETAAAAPSPASARIVEFPRPGGLPREHQDMITRARAALDRMHPDDRNEAEELCAEIEQQAAAGKEYGPLLHELQDLLYFIGA